MDEVIDWMTFYNHRRIHSTLGQPQSTTQRRNSMADDGSTQSNNVCLFGGENRRFIQRTQIRLLIEAEFAGLVNKKCSVGFFEEELSREQVCDMFAADHDRHCNIDQSVFAAINVVGHALLEL
jgi:hypothetical protein